jgi:uracil-DNA glycosylase
MRGDEPLFSAQAESLLQWWNDAGVDCLVDEAPRDWLRLPAAVRSGGQEPLHRPAGGPPPRDKLGEDLVLPGQLGLFHEFLASDGGLPFAAPQAPRVCPSGDPASGLMMLTDMPTGADCGAGTLLSGPAGALFDRMLAAIGRDRGSIYLAALSCLPSASGSLTGESAARCAEIARHHVGLVGPKVLLLLGDACAKAMLGVSVIQGRGRWHKLATAVGEVETLVSFHPAYLLEQPAAKRHAWADLQMVMERLGGLPQAVSAPLTGRAPSPNPSRTREGDEASDRDEASEASIEP